MFTGIIEDMGRIERVETLPGLRRLLIRSRLTGFKKGASVAVNGTCLTVVRRSGSRFAAEAARETLALTTLGALTEGDRVNLERALRMGQEIGGHLVQGHVDGLGHVLSRRDDPNGTDLALSADRKFMRYLTVKGSVAVDGVSLTVNRIGPSSFSVYLIPYTLSHTTLGTLRAGQSVNLEFDILAKQIERLLPPRHTSPKTR
ncbi:MAG: riboflavin synthase [Nitrospirae bacterium]|nr:riboflavin synthase [Nitrospirota bacterium]